MKLSIFLGVTPMPVHRRPLLPAFRNPGFRLTPSVRGDWQYTLLSTCHAS